MIFLALILILVSTLRFLPAYITGLPFSIDAWPLIRDINILIENSPIDLVDKRFDGYNNYWPGSILLLGVLKVVTGLSTFETIYSSISNFITIIVLYILVKRKLGVDPALLSTFLLAIVYPISFFTAGFTKELVALPLYLSIIYIILYRLNLVLIAPLIIVTLVITHHLTSLMTLLILLSISILRFHNAIYNWKIPIKEALLSLYLFLVGYTHYVIFGVYGMKLTVDLDSTLVIISYYITFMFFAWLTSKYREISNYLKVIIFSTPFIITILLAYYMLTYGVLITGPNPGFIYIIYGLDLIIMPSYIAIGIGYVLKKQCPEYVYWLFAITSILASQIFVPNIKPGIPYSRVFNFTLVPAIIIASAVIYNRLKDFIVPILIGFIIACSFLCYISSYNGNPYLGYQWWYKKSEVQTGYFLNNYASNLQLAGDLKVKYLFNDFFMFPVDTKLGLQIISLKPFQINTKVVFIAYESMWKIGYLNKDFPKPIHYGPDILENYSIVYNNGYINCYMVS